jgi:hypothetical protein
MGVDHSIDVGALLGTSLGRLSEQAGARLMSQMRLVAQTLKEFVLSSWPVDTATSLQDWEVRSSALRLIVRNSVDYAEYVHRAGESSLVHEEIGIKAEELVDAALPDMRQTIAADLGPSPQIGLFAPKPPPPLLNELVDALFQAKVDAFSRVRAMERNRIRFGVDNRIPVASPAGRPRRTTRRR